MGAKVLAFIPGVIYKIAMFYGTSPGIDRQGPDSLHVNPIPFLVAEAFHFSTIGVSPFSRSSSCNLPAPIHIKCLCDIDFSEAYLLAKINNNNKEKYHT